MRAQGNPLLSRPRSMVTFPQAWCLIRWWQDTAVGFRARPLLRFGNVVTDNKLLTGVTGSFLTGFVPHLNRSQSSGERLLKVSNSVLHNSAIRALPLYEKRVVWMFSIAIFQY